MPLYDIFCAFTSSLLISPLMTIIDVSIIRSQINKKRFNQSIIETTNDYLNKKIRFSKPFGIMLTAYTLTYSTANLIDLYCKKNNINSTMPLLFGTSFVNILTIGYKDKEYSKIFNNDKYLTFSKKSYLLFGIRDLITISSCFIFKKDLTNQINKYMPYNFADFISSVILPIIAQIISTPLHILSIDIYNNPNSNRLERIKNIKKMYHSVCIGRVIRVIPSFCIGGFINDMLRNRNY